MAEWFGRENACHLKIMEKTPLSVKATKYKVGSTCKMRETKVTL